MSHYLSSTQVHLFAMKSHRRHCVLAQNCTFGWLFVYPYIPILFLYIYSVVSKTKSIPTHPSCAMQCNCVAGTDRVGGLVEVGGVLDSDLGGLVVAAAAATAAETNAAAGDEQGEECDQERDTCGVNLNNGVVGFYQAVVAVHPTRMLHAVYVGDEGKAVGKTGNSQANEVVLANGTQHDGREEMLSSDDDMVDQEEDDDGDDEEEDPETDEYTFVEISVYEVLEVSEKVHKCEIIVEEEMRENSDCVAVITGVPEKSLIGDQNEEEPKGLAIESKEGDQIKAFLPPMSLTNGNVKRRRGRSNGRRKRAGGRRQSRR